MPDMWMDVDAAVTVPVNLLPLIDDTDFKSIEINVAYNAGGLALTWHFVTTAGAITATAVTPTTGGDYDWSEDLADKGTYKIEIPASGGASINNDTEGFGWFTGVATGVLPWRGPVIGFRAAAVNDALIDGGDTLDVNVTAMANGVVTAAAVATGAIDADAIADGAIDTAAFAVGAINSNVIADGAFDAGALANGAISAAKFAIGAIDANAVGADAVVKIQNGLAMAVSLSTIDDYLDTEIAAIKAKTDNLPASPAAVGSAMTLADGAVTAAAIATGAIDGDAIAATAVTEIQSGLATAAALDAVDNFLDTEVAAIMADTDELQIALTDGGRLDLLVDAIKAKTDNLPAVPAFVGAQMDLVNAPNASAVTVIQAGLPTANQIMQEMDTNSVRLAAIDTAVNNEVAAIKGVTDKVNSALELDGAVYRFTANSLELAPSGGATAVAIREEIDANSTLLAAIWGKANAAEAVTNKLDDTLELDGAVYRYTQNALERAPSAGGAGAISWTVTITDGSNPLDGVEVWVSTDAGGTNVVASGVTNALGVVVFMLDAGAYYAWKQLAGYSFTNPQAFTVS